MSSSNPTDAATRDAYLMTMRQCIRICRACGLLNLSKTTSATACYYYRRYVNVKGIDKENKHFVTIACIKLATKVELWDEHTATKLDDIIYSIYRKARGSLPPENLRDIHQKAMHYEFIVMECCDYEFTVPHAYEFLEMCPVPDTVIRHSCIREAWRVIEKILTTGLCLEYSAKEIAAYAINSAPTMIKWMTAASASLEAGRGDVDAMPEEDWYAKYISTDRLIELQNKFKKEEVELTISEKLLDSVDKPGPTGSSAGLAGGVPRLLPPIPSPRGKPPPSVAVTNVPLLKLSDDARRSDKKRPAETTHDRAAKH